MQFQVHEEIFLWSVERNREKRGEKAVFSQPLLPQIEDVMGGGIFSSQNQQSPTKPLTRIGWHRLNFSLAAHQKLIKFRLNCNLWSHDRCSFALREVVKHQMSHVVHLRLRLALQRTSLQKKGWSLETCYGRDSLIISQCNERSSVAGKM